MANTKNSVVAVDIGGSKIMTAAFSGEGHLLASEVSPTLSQQGVHKVIERIIAEIEKVIDQNITEVENPAAICFACAGGVDTERGVVVTPSPHLPDWNDIYLADIIKEALGIDTYVINDASAAALGEHRGGAGKGVKHLVLLTLGTGIGGGIIIDGKLYLGAVGGAGELGHMTVEAHGPKCGCGNTGCLEMMASATAIARDAAERLQKGEKSEMWEMVGRDISLLTTEIVARAAHYGDKVAQEVIAKAAYYLGVGLVNVINIFNPELIVLGGGMAGMGEILIGPARKMAEELAFSINARAAKIVTAQLGNEAGVYGAAAYALDILEGKK